MKRIQISHNIVDEDLLKEVKRYMIAPWQKYLLSLTGVISLILGIINVVNQNMLQGVVLLVLGAVCIGEIFFLIHSHYKEMLKLMKEEIDEQKITYTMSFGGEYVVVHNCQTSIDNRIPYSHLKTLSQTEHAYVLLAKKNEIIIIRKDCLKVSVHEFIDFLKQKDTKITKWIKA